MNALIRFIEFTLIFYSLKTIYTIEEFWFTICKWNVTVLRHSREHTFPKILNEKQKKATVHILTIFVWRGLKLTLVSFEKILHPYVYFELRLKLKNTKKMSALDWKYLLIAGQNTADFIQSFCSCSLKWFFRI